MGKMGIVADKDVSEPERQNEKQNGPRPQDDRTEEKEETSAAKPEQIDPETVQATRTLPCEDPSPTEPILSANATAYNEDARNFR